MESLQSNLRMSAPRSRRRGRGVALLTISLQLGLVSALSQGNDRERLVDSLRTNVVRVQAQEDGFGFIVGERGSRLYIVTARHVVIGRDDVPTTEQGKVKVEFFDRIGKLYDAELLGTHDLARDLAVLTVAAPQGVEWAKECLATEEQKRGTSVWFIGRDREWKPSVSPGHLLSAPTLDGLIEIEGMAVKPGSSGGPAISDEGIIGMIETDSAENTRILSVDFIHRALEGWNHPWNLLPIHDSKSGSDVEAINDVVRHYAESYNHKDSAALWKLWPAVPADTKQTIEKSFRMARSIVMSVQAQDPALESAGTAATVKGHYSQIFTASNGSRQKSQGPISFHLVKKDKMWIMTAVE